MTIKLMLPSLLLRKDERKPALENPSNFHRGKPNGSVSFYHRCRDVLSNARGARDIGVHEPALIPKHQLPKKLAPALGAIFFVPIGCSD
jgi:hypothetical protein